jgi:hypothetical protein
MTVVRWAIVSSTDADAGSIQDYWLPLGDDEVTGTGAAFGVLT